MQGIIFDIKRFAIHDGPGIRTTVFLKGCPLSCVWCHNPEGISFNIESFDDVKYIGSKRYARKKQIGYSTTVSDLMVEIRKDKMFIEGGSGGVTLSGGEPLSQPEFACEILKASKKEGFHTAIDTSGFVPKYNFEQVIPYTDLFLYDVKFFNGELHQEYTGVNNKLIWENLEYLVKMKSNIDIRIPVIPDINITDMVNLCERLVSLGIDGFNKLHLLPFHRIGSEKYNRFNKNQKMIEVEEPDNSVMKNIAEVFINKGFNVLIHT